jgi:hypothetical protein
MTDEESRAIEWECARLINLYANLNDEARWEEAAALYAEDGLMTRPTAPDAPIVGREALLAAFLARPPRTSQHVVGNIVVEVESEDAASAKSVILLFTGKEGPPLIGTYRDRFVRTHEGWRFSERRGALTW